MKQTDSREPTHPDPTETSTRTVEESSTATIEDPTSAGAKEGDNEVSGRSVELRGTRRTGELSTRRQAANVKGKVRLPRPRRNGNAGYVQQLLTTSLPLIVADSAVVVVSIVFSPRSGWDRLAAFSAST